MLETARLRVRDFHEDDRADFLRWHTDPENRKFKWSGVLSAPDAERDFDWILESSTSSEYGYMAIELRESGIAIGQFGLFPSGDDMAIALAYLIDRPHWGRGFATEAATAMVDRCRRRHPAHMLIAVIPDGHTASERVAIKLGMTRGSREERNGMTVCRWELPAPE